MRRHTWATGVAVVGLTLGTSACSGGDDASGADATTAAPSAGPKTPVQPKGAGSVTYRIQNWDAYADDPAVLAYKRALEAAGASINAGKLVPGTTDLLAKPVLRAVSGNVSKAKRLNWSVPAVAHVKIRSSRVKGSTARLVTCEWAPSTDIYGSDGKLLDATRKWRKNSVTLKRQSGTWALQPIKSTGTCPGGAPK